MSRAGQLRTRTQQWVKDYVKHWTAANPMPNSFVNGKHGVLYLQPQGEQFFQNLVVLHHKDGWLVVGNQRGTVQSCNCMAVFPVHLPHPLLLLICMCLRVRVCLCVCLCLCVVLLLLQQRCAVDAES